MMNITMSDEAFVYIVILPLLICFGTLTYFVTIYLLKKYTDIGIEEKDKRRK